MLLLLKCVTAAGLLGSSTLAFGAPVGLSWLIARGESSITFQLGSSMANLVAERAGPETAARLQFTFEPFYCERRSLAENFLCAAALDPQGNFSPAAQVNYVSSTRIDEQITTPGAPESDTGAIGWSRWLEIGGEVLIGVKHDLAVILSAHIGMEWETNVPAIKQQGEITCENARRTIRRRSGISPYRPFLLECTFELR